jgi:dTDP-4-dehydrorhamnose 3,5-epimerase
VKITPTKIPDVLLIEPKVFGDERGFFYESYNEKTLFNQAHINHKFVQDNHSHSVKNVIRGLHYQIHQPQGKLLRVVAGKVFDVAVDIRTNSQYFGQWVGVNLSAENKHQLWIPPGFAHGFLVVSEYAEMLYKTTDFYSPEYERTILWNDPEIGINWSLTQQPILSAKDQAGKYLKSAEVYT